MPLVTSRPTTQSNGDKMTEIVDAVGTTNIVYTFPTDQSVLYLFNKGRENITLTINNVAVVVPPWTTFYERVAFRAFTVRSAAQTQEFFARSIAYDVSRQFDFAKDFGAKEGPNYDNTDLLTDAIQSIPSNGVLIIPPGDYYYHHILATKSKVTLLGKGGTLVSTMDVTEGGSGGFNIFRIIGSDLDLNGVNFRLDHAVNYDTDPKPANYSNGHHIRLGTSNSQQTPWAPNIAIQNCRIDGGYGGAIDIYFGENVNIKNNIITNTLGNGAFFSTCRKDIFIEGNEITNTRDDGIFVTTDNNLPTGSSNVVIVGNTVRNSYAKGIGTSGVDGCTIKGNTLDNTWSACVQVFRDVAFNLNPSTNVDVSGNWCYRGGKNYGAGKYKTVASANNDGIYMSGGVTDVRVYDNNIFGSDRFGINSTSGNSLIKIDANKIEDCGSSAMNIGNNTDATYGSGRDYTITRNQIARCQQGIIIGGVKFNKISDNVITAWNVKAVGGAGAIYAKNVKATVIRGNQMNNTDGASFGVNLTESDADCVNDATNNLFVGI